MNACVNMNQLKEHYFLSNALTTIINILLNMEVEVVGLGHRVAKKDVLNVLTGVPNNNIFQFTL